MTGPASAGSGWDQAAAGEGEPAAAWSAAVCVGIAVCDVVQRVEEFPRWGVKSVATEVEVAAGGPATNAAVTAAALLGSATLVTALGQTPHAEVVRADLARHRVQVVDCAPDGWVLPVATCIVDARGERTVVSTGATSSPIGLTAAGLRAVSAGRGLLVDGHHPVAAERALTERPPSCLTLLDAGSAKPHVEAWLPMIDVAAGSADYAAGMGLTLAEAVAHVLRQGAGAAVMTAGAHPVLWATRHEPDPRSVLPPATTVVDTLGAGDAFHGGLLAGLVAGLPLAEAVALATRVASARVARHGARAWLSQLKPLAGAPGG